MFYNFIALDKNKAPLKTSSLKGKVVLIVNVASFCRFTSQYKELQELHLEFENLEIWAFPCNQFGNQEPNNIKEISAFCKTMNISFELMDKVEVNGESAHPLFKFLKKEKKGFLGSESIKWNFTKFLINKEGQVIERFAPTTSIKKIKEQIENII